MRPQSLGCCFFSCVSETDNDEVTALREVGNFSKSPNLIEVQLQPYREVGNFLSLLVYT